MDTSESKREKCESALTEALLNSNILQKDKEIQEGNYKAQLSTMSEHLANMNEKLISQTEEIQQLKFQLVNKVMIYFKYKYYHFKYSVYGLIIFRIVKKENKSDTKVRL